MVIEIWNNFKSLGRININIKQENLLYIDYDGCYLWSWILVKYLDVSKENCNSKKKVPSQEKFLLG